MGHQQKKIAEEEQIFGRRESGGEISVAGDYGSLIDHLTNSLRVCFSRFSSEVVDHKQCLLQDDLKLFLYYYYYIFSFLIADFYELLHL